MTPASSDVFNSKSGCPGGRASTSPLVYSTTVTPHPMPSPARSSVTKDDGEVRRDFPFI